MPTFRSITIAKRRKANIFSQFTNSYRHVAVFNIYLFLSSLTQIVWTPLVAHVQIIINSIGYDSEVEPRHRRPFAARGAMRGDATSRPIHPTVVYVLITLRCIQILLRHSLEYQLSIHCEGITHSAINRETFLRFAFGAETLLASGLRTLKKSKSRGTLRGTHCNYLKNQSLWEILTIV